MTPYKNPECGCCEGYADYLRQHGFEVTSTPTNDLTEISRKAGIPADLPGCHTAFIGNYVVDGHVPVEAIEKLRAERPSIKGVTLPGMPTGSRVCLARRLHRSRSMRSAKTANPVFL